MWAIVSGELLASEPVRTALLIGGGAAVVSGAIGVFTVIRGQSFAGHALADISGAGGSAAYLLGVNPLVGFLAVAVAAALGLDALDAQRTRERDLATGIVFGAGSGLTALLLYLDVTTTHAGGAAVTVLFGSMFAIAPAIVPWAWAVGTAALLATAALFRPLLLSAVDAELARTRGVDVRLVGLAHLLVLALAASLRAITVGAVLSTALLIGPAAIAVRLARRPGPAVLLAMALGVAATWGGIAMAYDSYGWTGGHGWPVGFCIVGLIFVAYVASGLRRA